MNIVEVEKEKKYAYIAGMCWIVIGILEIFTVNWSGILANGAMLALLMYVMDLLCYIGLGILLLKGKKNKAILGGVGILGLLDLYLLIIRFNIWNFIYQLPHILLFILLLFNVIPTLEKVGKIYSKKVWFIPGSLYLAGAIYKHIENFNLMYERFMMATLDGYFYNMWSDILWDICEVIALFFFALWLKEIIKPVKTLKDTLDCEIYVDSDEV